MKRSLVASVAAALLLAGGTAPAAHAFGSSGGAPTGGTVSVADTDTSARQVVQAAPATARAYSADVPSGPDAAMLGRVLELTNAYRAANGAPALTYDSRLQTIAENWSATMAAEQRMYHNPALRSQLPAGWTAFGENVLQNWDDATAQQLVQQWIDSPAHRAAMINPDYTHVGLGYALAADGKAYATQEFARY